MKRYLSVFVAVTLLSVPAGLEAQDTEWNRYTLDGLGGVFVRAEADGACESAGVTASSLLAESAVKLIEASVDVLTEDQMLENAALPELRISVECVMGSGNGSAGVLAYGVSVRVQQSAAMIRDAQVTLPEAVTWYATEVGVASSADAAAALGRAIDGKIEQFAEAYIAANAADSGN
jgi:hypothetical protein